MKAVPHTHTQQLERRPAARSRGFGAEDTVRMASDGSGDEASEVGAQRAEGAAVTDATQPAFHLAMNRKP